MRHEARTRRSCSSPRANAAAPLRHRVRRPAPPPLVVGGCDAAARPRARMCAQALVMQTASHLGLQRASASSAHWAQGCICMGCRTNLKKDKRVRNRINAFRFKKGGFVKRRFFGPDYAAEAKKAEEDSKFFSLVRARTRAHAASSLTREGALRWRRRQHGRVAAAVYPRLLPDGERGGALSACEGVGVATHARAGGSQRGLTRADTRKWLRRLADLLVLGGGGGSGGGGGEEEPVRQGEGVSVTDALPYVAGGHARARCLRAPISCVCAVAAAIVLDAAAVQAVRRGCGLCGEAHGLLRPAADK